MKDETYKFLKSKGDRFEFCYKDKKPFLVSGSIDVELMEEFAAQPRELIDYKIEAERKAKNKELAEWGCAFPVAIIFVFFILVLIQTCK